MESILGSLVATITIAFLYFMFRRNSQPIFKKNKQQLLVGLIPIVIFCIFFPKAIKIAIIFFNSWDYFIYNRLSQWEVKFYKIRLYNSKSKKGSNIYLVFKRNLCFFHNNFTISF